MPGRRTSAPTPCGPPNLCADNDRKSTPNAPIASAILPAACTASEWTSHPRCFASFAACATGLNGTGFIVDEHERQQTRLALRQSPIQRFEINQPRREDRGPSQDQRGH